jgi:hypothetical protein
MPAHTMPAHTMPAHTMPAHTMPAHTMPAHTMPAHTMPAYVPAAEHAAAATHGRRRGGHEEGWRSPVSRPSRKRWPGSHLRGFESLTFRRRAPRAPVRPVGLVGQGRPALTREDARFESGTGHSPYAQLDPGPFDHGLGRETFTLAERVRVPQGLRRSGAARSARVTHDHEVPGSNPGSATRPRQPAMPGATPL